MHIFGAMLGSSSNLIDTGKPEGARLLSRAESGGRPDRISVEVNGATPL